MPVSEAEIRSIMAHFETWKSGGKCEQCGFDWRIPVEDAQRVIADAPRVCGEMLASERERARTSPAPGVWSPSAYVWHMADAMGVWAERLVALKEDPGVPLVGFDQDDLGEVRGYDRLSTAAGLWAFERRVADWEQALANIDLGYEIDHPDFGPLTVADVVRWMAHDLYHHEKDIERALA